MKKLIVASVLAVFALAGCADHVTRERIKGVDCIVVHNHNYKHVEALDCDWGR